MPELIDQDQRRMAFAVCLGMLGGLDGLPGADGPISAQRIPTHRT